MAGERDMSMMEATRAIQARLPREERLLQLAEECAELTQAALKLRRALDGGNYTPVGQAEAEAALYEEIGDVFACVEVLFPDGGMRTRAAAGMVLDSVAFKLRRWAERLEGRG